VWRWLGSGADIARYCGGKKLMNVQGRDCSLIVMTTQTEISIPYTEETIRENVALLEEYPSIEGKGNIKAIRTSCGAVGCVVSPLTILTAPLLFHLALGDVRYSHHVSETINVYRHYLDLLPMSDSRPFGLLQDRGSDNKYYPGCRVSGFELRIIRDEAIKLKLDIYSEKAPVSLPFPTHVDFGKAEWAGERFKGENVTYRINDREYKNIYGVTLAVNKVNGTKTELWIRRVLEKDVDLPETIDEISVTALLLRDCYEDGHIGKLRITLRRLMLVHDETSVECADSVIGPLRYFAAGDLNMAVYSNEQ
jgi:hypothetical protein